MAGRIYPCIWRTGEGAPSKDEQTEVAHWAQSEVLNKDRGWTFDPEHFRQRLTRRPPVHNKLWYPNVEGGIDKDVATVTEVARSWYYSKGRMGYEAFAPWPIEVSWGMLLSGDHATWLARVSGFKVAWGLMGGAGVPLYRGQRDRNTGEWMVANQDDYLRMLEQWIAWMRGLVGDMPLYIVGSTHCKGADDSSPWQDADEFAAQARAVTATGCNFVVFDRFDNEADLDRAKAMVAGASA